jgi:hypothetical protein
MFLDGQDCDEVSPTQVRREWSVLRQKAQTGRCNSNLYHDEVLRGEGAAPPSQVRESDRHYSHF